MASAALTNHPGILVVAASAFRRASLLQMLQHISQGLGRNISAASTFSLQRLQQSEADVVVTDLDSPDMAQAMLGFLTSAMLPAGAVALVDNPEPHWVRKILSAGVNAIISREVSQENLRLAIEAADAGYVLLHPTSARGLLVESSVSLEEPDYVERLTPRERQVLFLMSEGLGNKEIAARLGISDHTVKFHASSILGKLGAGSRTEAVSQGIKRGLISL